MTPYSILAIGYGLNRRTAVVLYSSLEELTDGLNSLQVKALVTRQMPLSITHAMSSEG